MADWVLGHRQHDQIQDHTLPLHLSATAQKSLLPTPILQNE
jgi:hypothetical protein